MKATGTALWASPNTDATNSSGFRGLPGGYQHCFGAFELIGGQGYWWSSSEFSTAEVWYRRLTNSRGDVITWFGPKTYGFSVRCLKD